jgi:hypothetical protein
MRRSGYPATAAVMLLALSPVVGSAQEDDSGTNPTNFMFDFRMSLETQSLPGDNSFLSYTFEYRVPISSRVASRVRVRSATLTRSTSNGTSTVSGLGDVDARLLYLPVVRSNFALATGLEVAFNTASQPELGSGHTTLGPQVFFAFFNLLGAGTIFAPAYQYVFSVDGSDTRADVSRSQIDLFLVWLAGNKKHWAVFDPQIVFDHESDREFGLIEAEIGQMMFGATSSYIRPGVGIGEDRPYDWNIELGFKVIWR